MALASLARRIFGSPSDRHVKRFQGKVSAINALEPQYEKLSDDELRAKTAEFKTQLEKGADLDDLIVQRFLQADDVRVVRAHDVQEQRLAQRPAVLAVVGGAVPDVEGHDAQVGRCRRLRARRNDEKDPEQEGK